jgi:hypothetical protein
MNHFKRFSLIAAIILPAFFSIQAAERNTTLPIAIDPIKIPRIKTLGCCDCVGQTENIPFLDLSTNPTNNWTVSVNGGPATAVAYLSQINGFWNIPPPAGTQWVSTVATAGSAPQGIPPGTYLYQLKFYVQNCTIPQNFNLSGSAAADDDYEVYVDTPPTANSANPLTFCSGGWCFYTPRASQTHNPAQGDIPPFSKNLTLLPGYHSLFVKVNNDGNSYSGMFINAKLTGNCSTKKVKETVYYPYDRYDNGKLTINAVDVPDVFGGVVTYKANLSLKPQSNPLTFILDQAEPIPAADSVQECIKTQQALVPPGDTAICYPE